MTSPANQDHRTDDYGRILPPSRETPSRARKLSPFLWGFAGAGFAFLVLIVIVAIAGS